MPVKNDPLFKIGKLDHNNNTIQAILNINKDSNIFAGHFPGQPIVPGACMLQIVKDVLETGFNISLQLKEAGYLKFMIAINPQNTENAFLDLSYELADEDYILATAKLTISEGICFKFQGMFVSNY